jgi:hypothetical protein
LNTPKIEHEILIMEVLMEDNQISKYDRLRGRLQGIALWSKPSTIKNTESLTGRSETFIIETARHELGDYVFLECVSDGDVVRLALPPKVANAIASQRDALTTRRRSITGRRLAKERAERGEVPGFMRKK